MFYPDEFVGIVLCRALSEDSLNILVVTVIVSQLQLRCKGFFLAPSAR